MALGHAALLAVGLALVAALLLQAIRLRRTMHLGRHIAQCTVGFAQTPRRPRRRVLVMGDSTGLGVGASAGESLAGLFAVDHPDTQVLNVSRCGARLGDMALQLQGLPCPAAGWDLVLLHAGGNDVLRGTSLARMRADADALLASLGSITHQVVWLGPANIGLLPVFVPPWSWWLSRRCVQATRVFGECAARAGAHFVDFCRARGDDPYSADPERFIAADRMHPTREAYRHCYQVLNEQLDDLQIMGRPTPPEEVRHG